MDRVSNAPFPEVKLIVILDPFSSHNNPHGEQDEFGSLCRHFKSKQMRLPRKKDLERKQQAILKFTKQSFTDVRGKAENLR
jgi:hypothetical protein